MLQQTVSKSATDPHNAECAADILKTLPQNSEVLSCALKSGQDKSGGKPWGKKTLALVMTFLMYNEL